MQSGSRGSGAEGSCPAAAGAIQMWSGPGDASLHHWTLPKWAPRRQGLVGGSGILGGGVSWRSCLHPFFPPLTVLATLFGAPLLHLMFPPKYSSSAHMVPKHRSKGPDERSWTAAGCWDLAFSPAAKHSWRGSELFWLLWTAVALWREVAGSDVSRDTRKGLSTFLIGTLGPVLKAAPGGRRARHPTM